MKNVRFSSKISVRSYCLSESEIHFKRPFWQYVAMRRARFQNRIKAFEKIIAPFLELKIEHYKRFK